MKTNYVPAIVMLTAGFINCLISIGQGMTLFEFIRQLLIVLVVFYFLGIIIRILFDKGLKVLEDKDMENESSEEEEASPEETESDDAKEE